MGKGAKIAVIIIAALILLFGGLALYLFLQPDSPGEEEAPRSFSDIFVSRQKDDDDTTPVAAEDFGTGDTLPDGIYNVLLVGADSRSADENEALGLSDSMMVISYDTNKNRITLVSFMRDSWVNRIGEKSSFKGRLNAAYKMGGPTELMDTLNLNFELGIKHYVAAGYEGFAKLIDQLDGLDVPLTSQEAYLINWRYADIGQDEDKTNRVSILKSQGRPVLEEDYKDTKVQHLNGGQALWYARNRTSPAADGTKGSDAVRINRQQELMKLIYQKVKSEKTLDTAIALITFAVQNVQTNMDVITMGKLGTRILKADGIEFVNVRVPFADATLPVPESATGDSVTAIYFDIEATAARLHEVLYGNGG